MRVARPARRLLGQCLAASRPSTSPALCRQFHGSMVCAKRNPRFRNIKAEDMGLMEPEKMAKFEQEHFPDFTEEELAALKEKYSPEQVEAILAAQDAVDPKDIVIQGRTRGDAYKPDYIDDYAMFDPRIDIKPPETPRKAMEADLPSEEGWMKQYVTKLADHTNKKMDAQLTRAMVRALQRVKESKGADMIDLTEAELREIEENPELVDRYVEAEDEPEPGPDAQGPEFLTRAQAQQLDKEIDREWEKELEMLSTEEAMAFGPTGIEAMVESPMGVSRYQTAEALELGKVDNTEGIAGRDGDEDEEAGAVTDLREQEEELIKITGMSAAQIRTLYNKVLVTRWVSNQTRLGKIRSTSCMAIAGNGNGWLGVGMAKSVEPSIASDTSKFLAIKNMKPIRRYENRTIFGNVKAKVSGTVVEAFARPPGFGLRVPHRFFEMCRAAGIHDISTRMPRSKNPMNSVKAMYQLLLNQPDPEAIAIGRGKKLVDARKVYYGGEVY